MNTKQIIEYCERSATLKWETARSLFKSRRYADCLFYCHLVLELLLKGKVVKHTKKMFPITHNLVDLAERAELKLTPEQEVKLRVITSFNLAGRYDDFKLSFYKRVTPSMAKEYFTETKKLILWLKKR